jgi:hypothetical protein
MVLVVSLLAACSSPTEIDTPREKAYLDSTVGTSPRIRAARVTVSFSDNSIPTPRSYQYTDVWDVPVEIDTSGPTSAIWMRGICTAPAGSETTLVLRTLSLQLDSFDLSARASIDGNGQNGEMVVTLDGGLTTEMLQADGAANQLLLLRTTDDRRGGHIVFSIEIDATVMGRSGLTVHGTMAIDY